ncbi:NADH-ubiquinone oxidoreductase complex I, 21 kDa subunit-domain-containing protein [Dipodascopsis uninucleata]
MSQELPVPQGPYPLIDADPHFSRVVRYFRFSDYLYIGAFTASGPLLVGLMEYGPYFKVAKSVPEICQAFLHTIKQKQTMFGAKPSLIFGFLGGFFYAYNRSSARFFGLTENEAEVKQDRKEMRKRAREGLPLYGSSVLPEHLQELSARYSRMAQFKLPIIPYFNVVNHNYHGVDTSKYYPNDS